MGELGLHHWGEGGQGGQVGLQGGGQGGGSSQAWGADRLQTLHRLTSLAQLFLTIRVSVRDEGQGEGLVHNLGLAEVRGGFYSSHDRN